MLWPESCPPHVHRGRLRPQDLDRDRVRRYGFSQALRVRWGPQGGPSANRTRDVTREMRLETRRGGAT